MKPPMKLPLMVEPCPCGHRACTSVNVRPVTYGQGIMPREEGEYLVHAGNAYPKLVEALQALNKRRPCNCLDPDRRECDYCGARTLLRELGEDA